MEEAPENGKELLHSAHANGMNEWTNLLAPDWEMLLQCYSRSTNIQYKNHSLPPSYNLQLEDAKINNIPMGPLPPPTRYI